MTSERWNHIQELFERAMAVEPACRMAWVDEHCAEEPAVRDEVRSLLAASEQADDVLHIFEEPSMAAPKIRSTFHTRHEGSYRIYREIGRGGMGVVYLARDLRLGRLAALKFLPQHLSRIPDAKARLIAEARAAAALDHLHIATIFEVGEADDGGLFIAMAYYQGETLKEHIARGPLDTTDAVEVALQIADGLSAAHRQGILHRDVKPANILLTAGGLVKILDFGLARPLDSDRDESRSLMGTIAYMSPEQLRGDRVDERADVWSLGVVLHEMLTGSRPFVADGEEAIRRAILAHDPDPLSARLDKPLAGLQRIVDRCLAKEPQRRYPGMADVLGDLRSSRPPRLRSALGGIADVWRKALPGNLPVQLTEFVGRGQEVESIKKLLAHSRLLTLTGIGGTGKTRLGIQVAEGLMGRFADGICFIPLAAIDDPGLVLPTIAQGLNLPERGSLSTSQRLKRFLADKEGLLLLDSVEQVVDAGPDIVDLLQSCPRLKILVTSRTPLHARGEQLFVVPPFQVPDPDELPSLSQLSRSEAVAFFINRARSIRPDFALTPENARHVAQICKRLDGLPLAIELAAARIAVLEPAAIEARLEGRLNLLTGGRDLPQRHQTLREAIAWSYDLLGNKEKQFFRRVAVFVGGWSLEAAEEVCRFGGDLEVNVLDGMSALIDSNLAYRVDQPEGLPRFAMLETIREFALECLQGSGEADSMARAHGMFFTDWAEQAEPWLTGPKQADWLARLDQDYDNLRAALRWSTAEDLEAGARISAASWRYWLIRGYLEEGRQWLARFLTDAAVTSGARRARILTGAGTLAHNQGDYAAARMYYSEGLRQYRALDDRRGIALTLNNLGWVGWRQGDYDDSRALSREALSMHTAADDRLGMGLSLNNLGWVSRFQGDFAVAEGFFEQSLAMQTEIQDRRGIAFAQLNLGWVLSDRGHHRKADALVTKALTEFESLGDRQLRAFAASILGLVAYRRGNPEKAKHCLQEDSLPLFREIGDTWGVAFALHGLGTIQCDDGDYEGAERSYHESLRLRTESEDPWGIARSLVGLGDVARLRGAIMEAGGWYVKSLPLLEALMDKEGIAACAEGLAALEFLQDRLDRAAFLLGAAAGLRARGGGMPNAAWGRGWELRLRKRLPSFKTVWDRGHSESLAEIIRFARREYGNG